MTTENYFKAQLGTNFTMNELHDLINAIHHVILYYEKKEYYATSNEYRKLYDKMSNYIDLYNNL